MDPLVVIGGGIAGTTCAKVMALENPNSEVVLVSSSSLVKIATNLRTIGRKIDMFDVSEQEFSALEASNLRVMKNFVKSLDSSARTLTLENGQVLKYSKLCICTGAMPKSIPFDDSVAKYVKTIRDTSTAEEFQEVLSTSKRVAIVGNGGIANELVHKISNCEILWIMKDEHLGAAFFDPVVSKFFDDILKKDSKGKKEPGIQEQKREPIKRQVFTIDNKQSVQEWGAALGPDWQKNFIMKGLGQKAIRMMKSCTVVKIHQKLTGELNARYEHMLTESKEPKQDWNVYIELSNGSIHGCDYVVSATGVVPNNRVFLTGNNFNLSPVDGGFSVSREMQTNIEHVYAAGDVCTPEWANTTDFWFQMRLWTQARQMGFYAGKCITSNLRGRSPELFFNFSLFTHVTKFFGFRVILLGLFNGQRLNSEKCQWKYSVEAGHKLVKFIHQNNRIKGAVLIGETNLEETFENLIYNQNDLTGIIDNLLDDSVDIDDFFD